MLFCFGLVFFELEIVLMELDCRWWKELVCGEVYDESVILFGGVGGYVGLFGNVCDLVVLF